MASRSTQETATLPPSGRAVMLQVLTTGQTHRFLNPVKKINEGQDVHSFLVSRAYSDIMTFLFQLNAAMYPQKITTKDLSVTSKTWEVDSGDNLYTEPIRKLRTLLQRIGDAIEEAPPDP